MLSNVCNMDVMEWLQNEFRGEPISANKNSTFKGIGPG